ncbi:hypothetical protein [Rheinheimera gaetbuli]
MKFDIKALANQQFKALVTVSIPTEELDKDLETVKAKARFIGVFRCLPVDAAMKQLEELQKLQESGDPMKSIAAAAKQMEQYFVGFEPVPGEELPFTADGQALQSNVDNIRVLLNTKDVRDAVQQTWQDARNKDLLAKNSRK